MKLFSFCIHKYGLVDDKGYQYCSLCGAARFVGVPPCNHIWDIHDEINRDRRGTTIDIIFVLRCNHCGEIKIHNINNNLKK